MSEELPQRPESARDPPPSLPSETNTEAPLPPHPLVPGTSSPCIPLIKHPIRKFNRGVRLNLPNRPQDLPEIYVLDEHPLAPNFGEHQGKIYLALMDDTPAARRALKTWLESARLPIGTPEGIRKAGDCMLARTLNGSGHPEDDEIQIVFNPLRYSHRSFGSFSGSSEMSFLAQLKRIGEAVHWEE
ncbi:hypothetical protein C8Q79DRAFT_1007437 [Trametes meyenii]|nr:hypothetical protein C8Q79DRAFT_1007437 [Trametes meyenii]